MQFLVSSLRDRILTTLEVQIQGSGKYGVSIQIQTYICRKNGRLLLRFSQGLIQL